MRDLFADYVQEASGLMPFYAHAYKALENAPAQATPWAPALVRDLHTYQAQLGNEVSFAGNEPVIVTGQQPGLFTGPLYTLYKAVTAIKLARRRHDQTGIPHVPVFWIASDDHDFEESRRATFLARSHTLLTLTYAPEGYLSGQPMHQIPIESSLHDLVDEAATQTRGSEMRREMADFLHESIAQSTSLSNWTARLLARLFRGTPLVLFTPELPAARALARPIFARELANPLATTTLINETGDRLRQLDYVQQIVKHPTACSFFLAMGDRRRKVLYENGVFHLPEEKLRFTATDLQTLLQEAPERFSPNAALRCVVQQSLFSAKAYVAGPGELAYWAQLKPVFARFELPMPIVYPRARGVLIDEKTKRIMTQLQWTQGDLLLPTEQLMTRALQIMAHTPSLEIIRRYRPRIKEITEPLSVEMAHINKQAAKMTEKTIGRIDGELDRLEQALARDDETQLETVRNRITRLTATLMPFRNPQERVLTVFSFLFEYGWELIPRLMDAIDVDTFDTKEIIL